MKKILLLGLCAAFLVACNNQETRYTQNSPEIDTFKAVIKDYNEKNYKSLVSHYSDTSKTSFNKNRMASSDIPKYHEANDVNYSSRGFIDDGQEIEMVIDDEGKTWVNFWATWKATLAANNEELTMPVHLTARFIDGKIVEDYGYWDPSEVFSKLQEIEALNNLPVDQKVIMDAVNKVVIGWNAHKIDNLKSVSIENLVRTTNGVVQVNNINEYEEMMNSLVAAFSDLKVTLDTSVIKDNKIYINWTVSGTNDGVFAGNPATGKKLKVHGFSAWSLNGEGKLTREDAYFDNLEMFNQLGLTPPKV